MTEADILHWIRDTSLGAAVRQSRWMFATGETLHFIGLSMLVGGILVVDLRLLGFIRRVPVRAALAFLPFVIAGFLINLATGIVFFSADPMMYWPNPAFKLTMLMILLAGVNALVFMVLQHRHTLSLGADASFVARSMDRGVRRNRTIVTPSAPGRRPPSRRRCRRRCARCW